MTVFVSNKMGYEQLRKNLQDVSLPEKTKVKLGSQFAGDVILSATKDVETQPVTEFYQDQYGVTGTGRQLFKKLRLLNY